ncbi:MAG: hypothetical protein K0S32_984 [Bacteroidetes bacterium]|jgi:hypothetical protein|nr:hypothetical protein [Bacteroidota bacterium]
MNKALKVILITLLVLNSMVLLGQIWPEGAPPFSGIINILTLTFNLFLFVLLLFKNKNK